MATLGKKKRRRIKRRARKEVAREYAGYDGVAQAQIGQAKRDYGRNVRDARGAQRVYTSQLSEMLGNIRASGLSGKYAKQIANDLQTRKAEAFAGVPYAISEAQRERTDAIATARAELLKTQADEQAAVGVRQNDLLAAARKAKTARVEERREEKLAAADDEENRGVMNATITAKNYLDAAAKKDGQEGVAKLLKNKGAFIAGVAKDSEGADQVDAREAVNKLIRKYRRDTVKRTLDPFVKFKNER